MNDLFFRFIVVYFFITKNIKFIFIENKIKIFKR